MRDEYWIGIVRLEEKGFQSYLVILKYQLRRLHFIQLTNYLHLRRNKSHHIMRLVINPKNHERVIDEPPRKLTPELSELLCRSCERVRRVADDAACVWLLGWVAGKINQCRYQYRYRLSVRKTEVKTYLYRM